MSGAIFRPSREWSCYLHPIYQSSCVCPAWSVRAVQKRVDLGSLSSYQVAFLLARLSLQGSDVFVLVSPPLQPESCSLCCCGSEVLMALRKVCRLSTHSVVSSFMDCLSYELEEILIIQLLR
ncbi:hypothetical protein Rs2_50892 [Raphanus sativus]|nr:hypothetical protein Rs2_50892 [Raphanus sativus]